jgi:hypothetical protein
MLRSQLLWWLSCWSALHLLLLCASVGESKALHRGGDVVSNFEDTMSVLEIPLGGDQWTVCPRLPLQSPPSP